MSQLKQSGAEREFSFPPPFVSLLVLNALGDAHQHWRVPSALFTPVI